VNFCKKGLKLPQERCGVEKGPCKVDHSAGPSTASGHTLDSEEEGNPWSEILQKRMREGNVSNGLGRRKEKY